MHIYNTFCSLKFIPRSFLHNTRQYNVTRQCWTSSRETLLRQHNVGSPRMGFKNLWRCCADTFFGLALCLLREKTSIKIVSRGTTFKMYFLELNFAYKCASLLSLLTFIIITTYFKGLLPHYETRKGRFLFIFTRGVLGRELVLCFLLNWRCIRPTHWQIPQNN